MSLHEVLYKKKRVTESQLLSMFDNQVAIPVCDAWEQLRGIYTGGVPADDEHAARLVKQVRTAAEDFVAMAKKIFSQLRRAYHTGGLTSNARNIFLKDTDSAEAKILGFVNTVEFITSSREALNAILNASEPLLENPGELKPDASTKALLDLLDELEDKNIFAEGVKLLPDERKRSQDPNDLYESFFSFFADNVTSMMISATALRTRLLHAAATRINNEYFANVDASLDDLAIITQAQSETLLRRCEPELNEVLDYHQRILQSIDDQVSLYATALKRPDTDAGLKQFAKTGLQTATAMHMGILTVIARTLTATLMKLRVVEPTKDPQPVQTAWQQEIHGRIERLSTDIYSCYEGTGGFRFYCATEVPSNIRLDVLALIAEKTSSVTTDLERIEADIESSKRDGAPMQGRTRAIVKEIRRVTAQLEDSLANQIDNETRTLREGVRGSKPYEREAAKRAMTKALEFATANLNSFSAPAYEVPPEFTQDPPQKDQPDSRARALAHKEKQAATLKARVTRDATEEYHAISQRLDSVKNEFLGRFVNDLAHADGVIEAMEAQLKAPGATPMSADAIWLRLKGAATQCDTVVAQLRSWIDTLAGDADFVQTEKQSDPAFDTLSERVAAVQRDADVLLAQFTEKVPELLKEAESMRLARQTTMFAQKPTWPGYKIMRGNDCIESVVKSGNRFLTAHESGNDYVQEYVIHLKMPSKLAELISDGESVQSAMYRAVVHVHYNGTDETRKPTACHFKTWDQRGSTNRNSDQDVHYGKLNNPATAAELIGELNADADKAPQRPSPAKSVGGAPVGANAAQRKNRNAGKGKRT